MNLNLFNSILILISGILLLIALFVWTLNVIANYKYSQKKIRTQERYLIAEIKRKKQQNVQSLTFSEEYDKDLDALLKVLVEDYGQGKDR